ncbi:hypothetical protein [Pectobacterium quasiaquaticum]|uniref:hypothetical protein n=1 Tax=Pectobacterium quasiaquaticum TaxID=2774015 RepID=UPI001CF7698D|nr:hypothetical protein [Pectobacterium quasiaquaticum]
MLHDAQEMINRNRLENVNITAIIETAQGLNHAEEIGAAGVDNSARCADSSQKRDVFPQ